MLYKKNGFFIEAGAWDGEYLSNSLFFEVKRNWSGLLVEPNKVAFSQLLNKHRKAYSINACLSIHGDSEKVRFDGADLIGGIIGKDVKVPTDIQKQREDLPSDLRSVYEVECFSLYKILQALGNPVVDYFSLDVEGAELSILKSIPWEKVDIKTMTVEVEHINAQEIISFLKGHNYRLQETIRNVDMFFVKM